MLANLENKSKVIQRGQTIAAHKNQTIRYTGLKL